MLDNEDEKWVESMLEMALPIAQSNHQKLADHITSMDINDKDKFTLEAMSLGMAFAMMAIEQHQFLKTEMSFRDFLDHCIEVIYLSARSLKKVSQH